MTVKDLVWVNVCQGLRMKQKVELEKAKREAQINDLEAVSLLLADIRALARDTNFYCRVGAYHGSKAVRGLKPFPDSALPSVAIPKQREEEEKLKKMTPEEREIYLFNKGVKITR